MDTYLIILIFIAILLYLSKKRSRSPPGLHGLPLVGMFPFQIFQVLFYKYSTLQQFSRMEIFRQMREKYGEIWSITSLGQRTIIFASYDILNETYIKKRHIFSGRPVNAFFDKISEQKGILFSEGQLWQDNRAAMLKGMRDLGPVKMDLEKTIIEEANGLIKDLAKRSTTQTNNPLAFGRMFFTIINRVIFNEQVKYDDPTIDKIMEDIRYLTQSQLVIDKCILFPKFFTSKLARFLFPEVDRYFQGYERFIDMVSMKCENHKLNYNEAQEENCILDYKLKETNCADIQHQRDIIQFVMDLYSAGADTTNTLFNYCLLMLGQYPMVQDDLRREIKNSTDEYTNINMQMRKNSPKLLSFIDEIHRFCCIVTAPPRRVMEKCEVRGYTIYPNDIIIGDMGTIFYDESLFENPHVFDPYRFMDEARTRYIPNKCLIPFGIGNRACAGENMANISIFLILSRFIFAFEISLPDETVRNFDLIFRGRIGFVHGPLEHCLDLRPL